MAAKQVTIYGVLVTDEGAPGEPTTPQPTAGGWPPAHAAHPIAPPFPILPAHPAHPIGLPPLPPGFTPGAGVPGPGGLFTLHWSPVYGWVLVPTGERPTPPPTTPPEGGTTPPPTTPV